MSFEAQDLIGQAIKKHKERICVNWSGGRDSTVVLHMALKEDPKIPVIFANTLCEHGATWAYIRKLWKEWDLNLHMSYPIKPYWQCVKEYGLPKVRHVIAKDCTEPEFKMMMYMAKTYGLDPLLKQIWAIKRNERDPALIMVGRDGMLAIAHRSKQFDGMTSGVNYVKDKEGREIPVTAWCEIWRKDMTHSFKTEVRFDEYVQPIPKSGYKGLWQTKPSVMLIKVAESVCLRKAFSVSGVYDPDEIMERA